MVARYSSSLARFMAVDPGNDTQLENPQSWNKYAYVRNNPLRSIDPHGTATVVVNGGQQEVQHFQQQLQEVAGPGVTLSEGTIQFDDTQLGSGESYSSIAREGLRQLASDATPGTLVLDKNPSPELTPSGEEVVKSVSAPAGLAVGAPGGGVQMLPGPEIAIVQVSGRDATGLVSSTGMSIEGPSAVALVHRARRTSHRWDGRVAGPPLLDLRWC